MRSSRGKTAFIPGSCLPMNLLTKDGPVAILAQNLIRVTARFFSGVLHPHLLGVCCPNLFFFPAKSEFTVDEKDCVQYFAAPFYAGV
jgi:hypothetical protein